MTTHDDTYAGIIESVRDSYHERIMTFLGRCISALEEAGFPCDEPGTMHDDVYRWTFSTWRDAADKGEHDKGIDVTIEIAEAREYGDDDRPFGINFGLDIVEWGGRILGGLTPFNFTGECWVDARDEEAVAERWSCFEQADVGELPHLVA